MPSLRKLDASLGLIFDEGARIMFFVFAAAAPLIVLIYQFLAIPHRYSLDYGEAPLVDQAMRLAAGQNIYRTDLSTPPYTISNYPPLYVAVLAPVIRLFGAEGAFVAGRIISALAAWASSVLLMLIIHGQTRDRIAALSAGLVFLAFPFVVFWSPLLRIDMLALALSLGGLCLLVSEQPVSQRWLIGAALLLVAAIYTRQSYALAAPSAAFVWLLRRDGRQALKLGLLVAGACLILFLLVNVLTNGGFFFNIVTANVNEFRIEQMEYHWGRLREAALIPLCMAGASLLLIPRWNPLWALAAPYLVGAALSAATIGKIGSNMNYLLELCAALSLAAGVVVAWSRAHLALHSLRAGVMILLAFGVGKMLHTTLADYTADLRERRAALQDLNRLETLVADTPGPILADEYMGMLTLQGRPLVIQPSEITQLAWAGKWDQRPLLKSIEKQEFATIILYERPWLDERWTGEMLEAIDRSYRLADVVANNKVYRVVQRSAESGLFACPGAVWQLPGSGTLGVKWTDGGLDFFGQGSAGAVPVRAVADGLLMRRSDWVDAVAILHADPLRAGKWLWSYYGDMAAANGVESFVAEGFPLGAAGIPVRSGQLLGYQGSWSGKPLWPRWTHVHFALVGAQDRNEFPDELRSERLLDPVPYFNLGTEAEMKNGNLQSFKCSAQ